MATRSQPKLLAQGKARTTGGSSRPRRVRLYAPAPGTNKCQVFFKARAGEGEPWKRVLRRAASEGEARKIFAQAEAALDTEQAVPVGADVRASRMIRMLGEEYLKRSRRSIGTDRRHQGGGRRRVFLPSWIPGLRQRRQHRASGSEARFRLSIGFSPFATA